MSGNKRGGWSGGGGAPKRPRAGADAFDDDMDGMDFEEALAHMDNDDSPDLGVPYAPEDEGVTSQNERLLKWKRPSVPQDIGQDKLIFQQIDIDYYIGRYTL